MTELSKRERMAIPRHEAPARNPEERAKDFDEVMCGFSVFDAQIEASRCIQCARPTCIEGCPVNIHIKDFIKQVEDGDFLRALRIIKGDNLFPAICGRVCPQERQCEAKCVLAKKGKAVAIGELERFVADIQVAQGSIEEMATAEPTGKRVAIVGSGPAGLACAADLARMGHSVTVFEALHELGGVLAYGIPEFRLPREILEREINTLRLMGVEFVTNAIIGRILTIDELFECEGFSAVFLGVGAGLPQLLGLKGEHLVGVYTANEFLTRVNLMRAGNSESETPMLEIAGKRIAVIGGGNTAMDAVRVAIRLGAKTAAVLYRRTEAELPARRMEVTHAQEEGAQFEMLISPIEYLGDNKGKLTGLRLQKMELGEPDEGGRRRPEAVEGSEYEIPVDIAIIAVGNGPNPIIGRTTSDLAMTKHGTVVIDEDSGMTSKKGVFAGGDIVTGNATVISAMGAGRRAARAVNEYLCNNDV